MVVVRICVSVKSENIVALRDVLAGNVAETGKYEGCVRFDVYQDIQDEHTFILYQEWDKQASLKAYRASDYFKAVGGEIFPLLDGDPDLASFEAEAIS